ncbi:MAG: hypothetical protein J6Y01_06240 [Spirochaetales bacterium]|nr:hypothetical protein [Spirochaetales bacterium]
MRDKDSIIKQQKDFIYNLKKKTNNFIETIDKTEIEAILLSGSVARGDYFPGKIDGMVDLIIMKKSGSTLTAENLLGKNQKPHIPYHCVQYGDVWFAILFTDFVMTQDFAKLEEPRKFSFIESEILFDKNDLYSKEIIKINQLKNEECNRELQNKIGYIRYLLSEYKKDRWQRRGAIIQLHENLNTAIKMGICCLFYKNNSYVPAEDRALYYSFTLENLPENYATLISNLKNQDTLSEDDYNRRESLFRSLILDWIVGV